MGDAGATEFQFEAETEQERRRLSQEEEFEREVGRSDRDREAARRSFLGRSLIGRETPEPEVEPLRPGRVRVTGEFATPEVEAPLSEFELPEVRESVSQREREQRAREREVELPLSTRLTEIFRLEVARKLEQLEAEGISPAEVELDELLSEVLGAPAERRDRAIAFYQTLVLKSLDVLTAAQERPFGEIIIAKGEKWENP
jgi:chromatin segregation and condensation protein Rec8/ScpA/Scc1 (kleisin family)